MTALPCDRYVEAPSQVLHRAIDVEAPAAVVFRWLCQLRVAPYSYDWIDNFGRTSPRTPTPGLERLAVGQRFMTIFELVEFEDGRHITLALRRGRWAFGDLAVTYAVFAHGERRSRLLVRLVVRARSAVEGWCLAWGDLVMMRKQLLTLRKLAERAQRAGMSVDPPLLWHIPLSHFSEKVRWALDYKRVAHRRQVLGADYLFRAWWATGHGTLPILFLDGRAIGDSTHIIATLEHRHPDPPLYPADPAARQRALALEDYFDEQLGPALRAAFVTPLFRHDPDLALRALTTGMPEHAYRQLRPLSRIFPAFYRFRHTITDANLDADRGTVNDALDRIEQERQGREYLVGDAFTVADLTAAALLSPLLQPPEIQYPLRITLPPYLQDYRATLLRHPATQWATGIYRSHRGGSTEVSRHSD